MPINWDTFDQEIDRDIVNSVEKTNDQLVAKASTITTLSDKEIKALFPQPFDTKKFIQLMRILKSDERENIKLNHIMNDGMGLAKVTLKLLSKFVV